MAAAPRPRRKANHVIAERDGMLVLIDRKMLDPVRHPPIVMGSVRACAKYMLEMESAQDGNRFSMDSRTRSRFNRCAAPAGGRFAPGSGNSITCRSIIRRESRALCIAVKSWGEWRGSFRYRSTRWLN